MQLFLASSFNEVAPLLPTKVGSLEGKAALFIANAADNYDGDKFWIRTDREAFEKLGCRIDELDLRTTTQKDFVDKLEQSHIVHFCGGSVIYLISLIRQKELVRPIVDFVKQNKIIYSGTSAGSMIVARDLTLSIYDPEEKPFVELTKDYSGLGLVDFLIMPHASNPDFFEANKTVVEHLSENTQPLIFLNDNQAAWVESQNIEILEVNKYRIGRP